MKLANSSSALAIKILKSSLRNFLTAIELVELLCYYRSDKNFIDLIESSGIYDTIISKAKTDENKNTLEKVKQIFSRYTDFGGFFLCLMLSDQVSREGFSNSNNYQYSPQTNSQHFSTQETPFQILGIPKTSGKKEINKAFHKKSLINHPDRGGLLEKMQELVAAREQASAFAEQNKQAKERTVSR